MLRKLLGFSLLVFSGSTVMYSQKTPEPAKPEKPAAPQVFSYLFDGGSYLGIEPQEVTRDNFAKFGLSSVRGVAVEKVVENSPAAQAGLREGDVIVKFEGEEITSVRKLTRLISEIAPDHRVQMTILRGGSEQEITAVMGKREFPAVMGSGFKLENLPKIENMPDFEKLPKAPVMPGMPRVEVLPPDAKGDVFTWKSDGDGVFFMGSNRQIGVSVSSLTKQLGEYFGVAEGKGLLVNNVRENSPAAKAGLRAGDIIVEADGKEIKNNADLMRALNEKKEGAVQLTILRDRNRQTIQVTPEKLKGDLTPLMDENFPSSNLRIVRPQIQVAPYTMVRPAVPQVAPVRPGRIL